VRITVTNGAEVAWSFVPAEQVVEIFGEGTSRPAYVNTDQPTATALAIASGEHRIVDLYYPVPPGLRDAALEAFDLHWRVTTSERAIEGSVFFHLLDMDLAPDAPMVSPVGWGTYWWFDAFYPQVVFVHHPHVRAPHPGRFTIVRPPTRGFFPKHHP
jgi:hypothetical protein